jgi:NitT/TauT family transport system substrate-binding protein
MRITTWLPSALLPIALLQSLAPAGAETIHLTTVQSIGSLATYIAQDKGYFKKYGVDVDIQRLQSAADGVALLATNQIQILEGGISVGFFNGKVRNLPVIMVSDRVSTPIHHKLVVAMRHKDKVKKLTDLKGMTIGTNAAGSVTTYELGKVLVTAGMSLDDIQLKVLGFPQMGAALQNGALDATLSIPPFSEALVHDGFGTTIAEVDKLVDPKPMTIAGVFLNPEWAKAHEKDVENFFKAYMQATRDYCLAYHHGSNRAEVEQIALKNGLGKDIATIQRDPWTGRSLDGRVNMASVLDQQSFYLNRKLVQGATPSEQLFTSAHVDKANAALGAPPKIPDDGDQSCR